MDPTKLASVLSRHREKLKESTVLLADARENVGKSRKMIEASKHMIAECKTMIAEYLKSNAEYRRKQNEENPPQAPDELSDKQEPRT